ncbi:hypothetical protein H671_2g5813 [Cricetulus griseus]|nr:hypothetical protein H671_2g5813 [Cricetulus griseus]
MQDSSSIRLHFIFSGIEKLHSLPSSCKRQCGGKKGPQQELRTSPVHLEVETYLSNWELNVHTAATENSSLTPKAQTWGLLSALCILKIGAHPCIVFFNIPNHLRGQSCKSQQDMDVKPWYNGGELELSSKYEETGAIRTPCGSSCPLFSSEKELGKALVFVALEMHAAVSVCNGVFPGLVLTPEFLAEL